MLIVCGSGGCAAAGTRRGDRGGHEAGRGAGRATWARVSRAVSSPGACCCCQSSARCQTEFAGVSQSSVAAFCHADGTRLDINAVQKEWQHHVCDWVGVCGGAAVGRVRNPAGRISTWPDSS